jgi:2-amino-4-hydroxy-6-hydroxymethyldihydropteridine diphosphokinase
MLIRKQVPVFLGLGSNLGDKKKHFIRAIGLLNANGVRFVKSSSWFSSKAYMFDSNDSFLNAVIECTCSLTPEELLFTTQSIEKELGRSLKTIDKTYESRSIDIDILLFGNKVMNTSNLVIPHPYIHLRDFVAEPLSELIPNEIHPILQQNFKSIAKQVIDKNQLTIVSKAILINKKIEDLNTENKK